MYYYLAVFFDNSYVKASIRFLFWMVVTFIVILLPYFIGYLLGVEPY